MSKFKELLSTAWTAISDPNQKERVEVIVDAIEHGFKAQREKFDLTTVMQPINFRDSDLEAAKHSYYRRLLNRYWSDGIPNDSGKRVLTLVASKLDLGPQTALQLTREVGLEYLGVKVASFLQDGVLTDVEMRELVSIGTYLQMDIRSLFRQNSTDTVLGVLRGVFSEATWSGRLDPKLWDNLRLSASKLGFTESELVSAISQQARNYAEHVLADVKSDGIVADNEERYLAWLVQTFHFDAAFVAYIRNEVLLLKEKEQIAQGNLRTIPVPHGANLKSGELLYVCCPCTFRQIKMKQGAATYLDHAGHLLLTDNRILFQSVSKPIAIGYRSILHWRAASQHLQISVANKPEFAFYIPPNTERYFAEKFTALVQLHSQTLVRKAEAVIDRHIPRDVRQRVWQR